ncbi:hypothetical protein [Nocardiopsis oceani]
MSTGRGGGTAPEGFVSLRRDQALSWSMRVFFAVFILLGMGALPLYVLFGHLREGQTLGEQETAVFPMLALGAGALVWLVVLTAALPRSWSRQGVRVDHTGITLLRDALWWSSGRRSAVPWTDIHHITLGHSRSGRGRTLVRLHLHRPPFPKQPLPQWATRAPADRDRKRPDPWPQLILAVPPSAHADRLVAVVREAAPDLFGEAVVEQTDALRRANTAEHRAPTAADPGPDPVVVDTRRRRARWWTVGALVVLYYSAMGIVMLIEEVGSSRGLTLDNAPATVLMAVTLSLLWWWVVWGAPRCMTRQGVRVDRSGLTLIQEPLLWFGGRTVALPWDGIRLVRGAALGGQGTGGTVTLLLQGPDAVSEAPTWCTVNLREEALSPASPDHPLTRISISVGGGDAALAAAVRAMRPDLTVAL